MNHNELAASLARHLHGMSRQMMIWTDLQLGQVGSMRPDVLTIDKTYSALRVEAYEVKVSRSDFMADVTTGKCLKYLDYAGALWMATPAGLVAAAEVPPMLGLIQVRDDGTWRTVRRPKRQQQPALPWNVWLKLLMDGLERERATRSLDRARAWSEDQAKRKALGEELALVLAAKDQKLLGRQLEIDQLGRRAQLLELECEKLAQRRDDVRRYLAGLGIDSWVDTAAGVARALSKLRPEGDADAIRGAVTTLRRVAEELAKRIDDREAA